MTTESDRALKGLEAESVAYVIWDALASKQTIGRSAMWADGAGGGTRRGYNQEHRHTYPADGRPHPSGLRAPGTGAREAASEDGPKY